MVAYWKTYPLGNKFCQQCSRALYHKVASLACENYAVLECGSVNAGKHLNFMPHKSSVPTLQRTLYTISPL